MKSSYGLFHAINTVHIFILLHITKGQQRTRQIAETENFNFATNFWLANGIKMTSCITALTYKFKRRNKY